MARKFVNPDNAILINNIEIVERLLNEKLLTKEIFKAVFNKDVSEFFVNELIQDLYAIFEDEEDVVDYGTSLQEALDELLD